MKKIHVSNTVDIKRLVKRYKNNKNIVLVYDGDVSLEYQNIIKCFNIKDKKERISFIYDYLCDYLDKDMNKNNYCDFIDGKCIANRLGYSVHKDNGCCYSRGKLCSNLKDGICVNKNPSCKIFMCYYLYKVKGIKNYDTRKILLTSLFLSNMDHFFFRTHFFISKEEFLNKYFKIILVK